MAEKKKENTFEKTAERMAEVSGQLNELQVVASQAVYDTCGAKKDGKYLGLDPKADQKKASAKVADAVQEFFYTKIVGMKPSDFAEFKKKFLGKGITAAGDSLEDILGDVNALPDKATFADLITALYKQGVKTFNDSTEQTIGELSKKTNGKLLSRIVPQTNDELKGIREFITKYHPAKDKSEAGEALDPQKLAMLYQQAVPYYVASKN